MYSKISIPFIAFALFMLGCKKPQENPVEKLASLKEQAKKLDEEIKLLETEVEKSDTSKSEAKAKLVDIDTLSSGSFHHYIDVQGVVDASQNILVGPEMPGIIKAIYVHEGDKVSPGKVLAALDGATIRKGIEEVKTGLSLATTMYEKQKRLWEQNIGSEAQYLQAKGQKESLEQRLQTMESQLSMTLIKSPIAGTVDELRIKIGEAAAPGMSGVRVVNGSKLSVKAKLSDLYAGKVKKGDKVKLYFPDLDKEVDSKITYCGQTVNLSSRTIMLEAELPVGKNQFIANQIVKLKINDHNVDKAVVVSTNLIQRSIDGNDYILTAEQRDGKWYAKKNIVKTNEEYNGKTVVSEGIKSGELIISSGYNDIVEGQLIQF